MKNGVKTSLIAFFLVACLWGLSSFYVVKEGYSALVLRLGKLEEVKEGTAAIFGPGLHYKTPILNVVKIFDTRLQTLDIKSSRIVTKEKKDVMVDYYVKWRISDLARYYKATGGNAFNAESLLEQLLNTSLRAEFGKRTIPEVVAGERDDVMGILKEKAGENALDLGMSVMDVRIKGIDLPATTSSAIYQRMRASMEEIANRHRADGRGAAEAIRAHADKETTIILASAKSEGEKIRAKGRAQAEKIYAEAFAQAPEFFAFYRSLKAYVNAFHDKHDLLVLDQDGQFFNYFKQSVISKGDKTGKS